MQPPQFTTRGLLLMTAIIGTACGCFGAVVQVHPVLAAALVVFGIFCLGASIGVPFGRPFRYGFVLMGSIVLLVLLTALFIPAVQS